jgi:sugar/nucleoside kinase (ribokinase family)
MEKTLDVVGIGNAIVDVLSFTDEALLAFNNLPKGSMTLIDETRAHAIYHQLGQTVECSGGSVANSLAGLASLGANTAFIGKVKNDQLGTIFSHDMRAVGVHFSSIPATQGPATAQCMICVTPDAQRTMATYLGACGQVTEDDIDERIIAGSKILYIEGYLWDNEAAKAAIRKAIAAAKKHGTKVAFTLSDVFCVSRHRDEFAGLLDGSIDILFANEHEILAQFVLEDFDHAITHLQRLGIVAAVTRSEKGSVVVQGEQKEVVPAKPIASVVDTTGAGDLYAAGFLFGLVRGWSLEQCAALGNRCAGQIIQQLGARSQHKLDALVA